MTTSLSNYFPNSGEREPGVLDRVESWEESRKVEVVLGCFEVSWSSKFEFLLRKVREKLKFGVETTNEVENRLESMK
jgi:hypothetical protein